MTVLASVVSWAETAVCRHLAVCTSIAMGTDTPTTGMRLMAASATASPVGVGAVAMCRHRALLIIAIIMGKRKMPIPPMDAFVNA